MTHRKVEVLRLLAAELSYAQIAEHLVISPRTVDGHLRSIYSKLGVSSRMSAEKEESGSRAKKVTQIICRSATKRAVTSSDLRQKISQPTVVHTREVTPVITTTKAA